jgi:micrococcal nuclease
VIEPAPAPAKPTPAKPVAEAPQPVEAPVAPVKKAAPRKAAAPKKPAAVKKAAKKRAPAAPLAAWVEASGDVCPTTHPVKAKLSSRLYHLPGMLAYARTRPDRCYATEDAAVADGLTKSRR